MQLFSNSKPKIKKEKSENRLKVSIDYFKLREDDNYKINLLKNVADLGLILTVLNTEFLYNKMNIEYAEVFKELVNKLNALNIRHIKLTTERKKAVTMLGLRLNKEKTYEDEVIGFMLSKDNVEAFYDIINTYNMQYYVFQDVTENEILNKFQEDYKEEEKLRKGSRCTIYDDNFIREILIYCNNEDENKILK